MNKTGELEIAVNKRMVERAIFILIIIGITVFFYSQKAGETNGQLEEVAILTQRVNEQNAQLEQLTEQLSLAEEKVSEAQAAAEEAQAAQEEEVEEEPELSGTITYDWEVDGTVLTPAQYNADEIDELEAELNTLEDELEDAEGDDAAELEDEIDVIEDQIRDLKVGESKFRLNNVSVAIDNGKEDPAVLDYVLCWPQLDPQCTQVVSKGTMNIASGASVTQFIDITIPRTIAITKSKEVLRLTIKQDNKDVFKEDYTITATP